MSDLEPINVSVKKAADLLGVSTWLLYKRLDEQAIESTYEGRKRLVNYASLKAYAAGLPSTPPQVEAS